MSKVASPKQFGFIRRLLEERTSQVPEGVDAFMAVIEGKRLTGTGASLFIDKLLAIPADRKEAPATAAVSNRDPSRRSNSYPGKCRKCGHTVAKLAGYLVGSPGNWGTEHLDGECPTSEPEAPKHELSEIVGDLEDGSYAFPSWTEGTDFSFWKIATNQGVYNPANKGQRVLRQVTGHDPDGVSHFNMETARKVVASIHALGDERSRRLYGLVIGQCSYCGKALTSGWKAVGVGPKCNIKHDLGLRPALVEDVDAAIAALLGEVQ